MVNFLSNIIEVEGFQPHPIYTARISPKFSTKNGLDLRMQSEFDKSTQFNFIGPLQRELTALETGISMETIFQKPPVRGVGDDRPPLVFIHGSYHGAWCWAEHWMPYFSSQGYNVYAISLRGTFGSAPPEGTKSIRIDEHVSDLDAFIRRVCPSDVKPIIIAHSMGGMVLMKYLESETTAPLAGAAWLCSTPPSGNVPMTKRFIKERPFAAFKIVLGFVFKFATFFPYFARQLFFSKEVDKKDLGRYMKNFRKDSKIGLDLGDLNRQLPILSANNAGQATWLEKAPPRYVLGAEKDYIIDIEGLKEMATFLDVEAELLREAPHDVMLGPQWRAGAERLGRWLSAL